VARYLISETAHLTGVEAHVLRYWEEELELEIPRNELGHRYYTEEHIAIFNDIKAMKAQGLQLKAIKENLALAAAERKKNGWQPESVKEDIQQPAAEAEGQPENGGSVMKQSENGGSTGESARLPEGFSGRIVQSSSKGKTAQVVDMLTGRVVKMGAAAADGADAQGGKTAEGFSGARMEEEAAADSDSAQAEAEAAAAAAAVASIDERVPMNRGDRMAEFETIVYDIVAEALRNNNERLGHEVSDRVNDKVVKELNYLMRENEDHMEEHFRKLDEALGRRGGRSKKEAAATRVDKPPVVSHSKRKFQLFKKRRKTTIY